MAPQDIIFEAPFPSHGIPILRKNFGEQKLVKKNWGTKVGENWPIKTRQASLDFPPPFYQSISSTCDGQCCWAVWLLVTWAICSERKIRHQVRDIVRGHVGNAAHLHLYKGVCPSKVSCEVILRKCVDTCFFLDYSTTQ